MIGFSLSLVSGQKGDPTPAPPADLAVNDLPRDKMVMDARIGRVGGGQARVALSGTATAGQVVQAYDRGADTWRDVATADGLGNWSGVLLSTNDDGPFQTANTRLKSSTGTTANTTNTFATGTVFMPFGQSEIDYLVNSYGGSSAPGLVTVADVEALQVIKIDNDEIASPSVVHSFITADTSLTKAIAVLSNTLAAYAPGRKFLYVDGHHEGTSRWELMDDSQNDVITGRRWSVLQQVVDWVRNNGSEIGQIVEMWFVADLGKQPFLDAWSPLYFGQTAAGTTFTLGTTHTAGGVNNVVDHCLFDMDVVAGQRGRGTFTRADTKLVQLPPLPVIPRTGDLQDSVTVVGGASAVEETSVKDIRQSYVDFHSDARTVEVAGDLLPNPFISKGYWNGTSWTNDTHPSHLIPEGTQLLAKHFARAVMIGSGDVTVTKPTFSVNATDATGAFVDLQLSGTGTLKTLRSIEAGTTPTGETYYTDVAGFEIAQGGSGYAIDGFTAVIQDAANRIVRITPDTAFVNDDKIRFGYGGGAGWYKTDSDGPNEWFKEFPLVDTNGAGLSYLFAEPWPQTPEVTLTGIAGAPATPIFTTGAAGPWFTDTANIPAATSGMTFRAKIKDGFVAANSDFFVDAASTTWRVEMLANKKIRLTAEDSTGAKMILNGYTTAILPVSGDFELGASIDLAAQWCKIFIDGVEVYTFALAAGTGVFVTNRKVSLLASAAGGASQVNGSFEYLKFWYSATVDGSEPAGAPDALIEGPAATANVHAWKQGADAS